MTSQEFVNQLKKDIQAFPKIRIKHPFLKAVCNGTATMDQIRAWAIQDYQFRAAVPRIAMMRYLACTDPGDRAETLGCRRGRNPGLGHWHRRAQRVGDPIRKLHRPNQKTNWKTPSCARPLRRISIMSS